MTVLARLLPLTGQHQMFLNATETVQKICKLIETGEYDADIPKYISGTLKRVYQAMLEHIDTKEQPANTLYKVMENLEFQLLLTNNYYTNLSSINICFPMKIKKASDEDADIDSDLITINSSLHTLQKK